MYIYSNFNILLWLSVKGTQLEREMKKKISWWPSGQKIVENIYNDHNHQLTGTSKLWKKTPYLFSFIWQVDKIRRKCADAAQRARKLKKVQTKNSWNLNFTKNFLTKFHFLQFKKWPKINFWTGKTANNAISQEIGNFFIYLISRVFLPGLF